MAYSITINTPADFRTVAADNGYSFVLAKGVHTSMDSGNEFNTAWIVLNPSEMGDSTTISWDAAYTASYTSSYLTTATDGVKPTVKEPTLALERGGYYKLVNGVLELDPNGCDPYGNPSFCFLGGAKKYKPVLLTQDNAGNMAPFWVSGTGMVWQLITSYCRCVSKATPEQ
jgi:hypothetical protein